MSDWQNLSDDEIRNSAQRGLPGTGGIVEALRRQREATEKLEATTKRRRLRLQPLDRTQYAMPYRLCVKSFELLVHLLAQGLDQSVNTLLSNNRIEL